MKKYLGYIRVSTTKQGEGVSLQEQRDAIICYAQRNNLEIVKWFEELETAAKRGRPIFNQMLKLLKQGNVNGVIIHKIDRSARNLKDWADLGELIDYGTEVHFANESLDLHSRGGRLSADIQAVVAADYIRNLREETRKGFYGRIKQGLYPLPAPLGYLDQGKGKAKIIDPVKGPLIRKAFELYASGKFTLDSIRDEMYQAGLRNKCGGKVHRTGFSYIFNNPFYIGLIRLLRTGETFPGVHEMLIPKSLFDRVQDVLRGKIRKKTQVHNFLFRQLFTCKHCGLRLIGERQKGRVYYRCHTKGCPTRSVLEENIEVGFLPELEKLTLNELEKKYLHTKLEQINVLWQEKNKDIGTVTELRLKQIQERLNRLMDAFIDQLIDKDLFEQRKADLLLQRKDAEEKLLRLKANPLSMAEKLREILELSEGALNKYKMGIDHEKRELLETLTSNREVDGKNVGFTMANPFSILSNRHNVLSGPPFRNTPRTLDKLLNNLIDWFTQNPAPPHASLLTFLDKDNREKRLNKKVNLAG